MRKAVTLLIGLLLSLALTNLLLQLHFPVTYTSLLGLKAAAQMPSASTKTITFPRQAGETALRIEYVGQRKGELDGPAVAVLHNTGDAPLLIAEVTVRYLNHTLHFQAEHLQPGQAVQVAETQGQTCPDQWPLGCWAYTKE